MDEDGRFASLLLRLRLAAGLTQEELAERSGVSARAISDMERGRARRPQRHSVLAIGEALALGESGVRELLAARARHRPAAGCALPPVPDQLTGRGQELAVIGSAARSTGGVLALTGRAGLGKTTLAVAAAHELASVFPAGRLFLELRGAGAEPVSPATALARLLRGLGVPDGAVPPPLEERIGLYRGLLRDRRVLVVLDDAADAEQVRALLPDGGASMVVVTSRDPLTTLTDIHRVRLDVLSPADAASALAARLGPRGGGADPAALTRLGLLCGRLPLALHLATNQLAGGDLQVGALEDGLADEWGRAARSGIEPEVRATLELAYRRLPATAAVGFRRLALAVGASFDAGLTAVLAGVEPLAAEELLDELFDVGLLGATADRYHFHDVVRAFAAEKLATDEPPAEVAAAEERMVDGLLRTVILAGAVFELDEETRADLRARSGPDTPALRPAQAADWLEIELPAWLDALRRAARAGRHQQVMDVAESMHWYSDRLGSLSVWPEVYGLAVAAARAADDRQATARHLNYLGWALDRCEGRRAAAVRTHRQALTLSRECGDVREEAWTLAYLGVLHAKDGEAGAALRACGTAVELFDEIGHQLGVAIAEHFTGHVAILTGEHAVALRHFRRSSEYFSSRAAAEPGSDTMRVTRAHLLLGLSHAHLGLGEWALADQAAHEAAELAGASGTDYLVAGALDAQGAALRGAGDLATARLRLAEASTLHGRQGARIRQVRSLLDLARVCAEAGDAEHARAQRRRALRICAQHDSAALRELAAEAGAETG